MYSIVWFVKMASIILSAAYSAGRMSRMNGNLKRKYDITNIQMKTLLGYYFWP